MYGLCDLKGSMLTLRKFKKCLCYINFLLFHSDAAAAATGEETSSSSSSIPKTPYGNPLLVLPLTGAGKILRMPLPPCPEVLAERLRLKGAVYPYSGTCSASAGTVTPVVTSVVTGASGGVTDTATATATVAPNSQTRPFP